MRRNSELTQKDVAQLIGVAPQQIQKYENNGRITVGRLLLYCNAVDKSVYAVLTEALKKIGVNISPDGSMQEMTENVVTQSDPEPGRTDDIQFGA